MAPASGSAGGAAPGLPATGGPAASAAARRASTTIRSAVFLPIPGIRVNAVMSPAWTSAANWLTDAPDRIASAIFAPMPVTFCTSRNIRRSASLRKPYSDTLSSFCA